MIKPDILQELYHERTELNKQIREAEAALIAQGISKGVLAATRVRSIDDLCCDKHPEAKFVVSNTIPRSDMYDVLYAKKEGDREMNVYECSSCQSAGETSPARAYECPKCGPVPGECEKRDYKLNDSRREGSSGTFYNCRLCNSRIGDQYDNHGYS